MFYGKAQHKFLFFFTLLLFDSWHFLHFSSLSLDCKLKKKDDFSCIKENLCKKTQKGSWKTDMKLNCQLVRVYRELYFDLEYKIIKDFIEVSSYKVQVWSYRE